ncbi:MAG: sigma-70 family RNA polymerase sigma factor [Bacteroidaceae bacterium]|nr:sigma-70 family RNA polymerase sigma factor [Bacteroidaceae bacterium]
MKEHIFREEILPFKDKLFRLALRITLDREEAEDIVQDTLLKMWERREEWDKIQSLESFCMTICRNLALDRNGAARKSNLRLNEEMDSSTTFTTPLDELDAKMRIDALRRFIDGLPEVQRSIIQLRDNEGKAYSEIGEILRLNESQVKVYLHRARAKLREQIAKYEQYGL